MWTVENGGVQNPSKKDDYAKCGAMGTWAILLLVVILFPIGIVTYVKVNDQDSSASCAVGTTSAMFNDNPCKDKNPKYENIACTKAATDAIEQAGADVTKGFVGDIDASKTPPITDSFYKKGLCPVNVHWHLGAEHRSAGQFDEKGKGPTDPYARVDNEAAKTPARRLAGKDVRIGYQCHHYDAADTKYTKDYDFKHCVDMKVGQTYEIHWPHSTVGACGTPYQYQTPFYDGVFCKYPKGGATTHDNVGVQSQVFTVVNDEKFYYPDLIKGAIVAGDFWKDVAIYTGSTTGTTRDNDKCSPYSPITWQVDRQCHLISASSFDKLCADMKSQVDDMSGDLYAHGARKLVTKALSAKQTGAEPAKP